MTTDKRKPLGLRIQILVGLGVVTLLAVLSTGYLVLWNAANTVQGGREGAALSSAAAAAVAAGFVIHSDVPIDDAQNRLRLLGLVSRLAQSNPQATFQIIGVDRQILAAVPSRDPSDTDPTVMMAVLTGGSPTFNYRTRNGHTELLAYAPILTAGRVLGAFRVLISAPSPVAAVLAQSGPVFLGLAIADALLVLMLGYLVLTRFVVRPLQAMQLATAKVSGGDWDQRITPDGPREIAGLAAAFNHMTQSLSAQREQLIRSEKLASVGQLAAGIAHEIGNPLAAVLGYVDILRLDAKPDVRPLSIAERADMLNRVKAETQRIHRTISDLLAYSRPSKEDALPTDPRKVLRSTIELLAPQARCKGVTITVTDPDDSDSWPNVLVSPERLTQVLVNLFLNAADAMNGDGQIHVRCESTADQVRVLVTDEGPGIKPDLVRKIFDPFFTTKDTGKGTGLGLSISRSIIESYGGTLELERLESKGATFVITLPRAK